ncbi:MAG: outer membrane beta-barrel protein [Tardiphaga sp.]|nr:outer membrane beta-barrel protein [Tardiphaga sp.]
MKSGPAPGRHNRAKLLGALSACLWLVLAPWPAAGQALTSDLLTPMPGAFVSPSSLPLRRTSDQPPEPTDGLRSSVIAPSRIGQPVIYGNAAAYGASASGYDSLNRRRQRAKLYPGARKPKPSPGPGTPPPIVPTPPLTIPPSSKSNKPPVSASVAGIATGQPARKRLKPDPDPFGPTGVYVGSFLVKSAVETYGGYDSNPARLIQPKGASFYRIAPELLAASDWSRHAVIVDLRGSFNGYDKTFPAAARDISPSPVNVDRIDFTGRIDGRIDVTRDTRINAQTRLRVGADNPGSPNIQAGLAKYPLFATVGGSLGVEQDFNRLQVRLDGLADRTRYQDSQLTDGTSTTNNDRDFDQYGGVGRVSYEVLPGLRPFGEVQGDVRIHDVPADRFGYLRDSSGGYFKAGTTFEFTRLLTGEASIGYARRSYTDPRLADLKGLLTSASLIWTATPLTTARFISTTSLNETTIPGVPGVLTRSYTAEVSHDFRRWLTAVGRFTYVTQDYQENFRSDKIYSLQGDLVYRLSRELQLKAQVRRDTLDSNVTGASTASTVVMLGVRLQR